jgi:hypothetical protein
VALLPALHAARGGRPDRSRPARRRPS